jgi:hypothetical protein
MVQTCTGTRDVRLIQEIEVIQIKIQDLFELTRNPLAIDVFEKVHTEESGVLDSRRWYRVAQEAGTTARLFSVIQALTPAADESANPRKHSL